MSREGRRTRRDLFIMHVRACKVGKKNKTDTEREICYLLYKSLRRPTFDILRLNSDEILRKCCVLNIVLTIKYRCVI